MKKSYRTLLEALSLDIGADIWFDPIYGDVGEITFASGVKKLFRNTSLALNSQVSAELAKDKGYALTLLSRSLLPAAQ